MFLVLSVSVGYSSLSTSLNITGLITKVRLKQDIRITNLEVSNINNEGQSSYNEYNKENISVGVNLPNSNSTVTYKVEVTNIGNVEMGILNIEGLPEVLEYELTDYKLKDKICDESNVCKLGISKEIYITIKYKENGYDSSKTSYDINLKFDFRQAYNVTYEGITNNDYPSSVLEGDTLIIEFTSPIPSKVVPYINDEKVEYTYENNIITVPNITGDILLKYQEKAYLTTLSLGTYFKESTYLTKIKTVQFVDSIDIPSDALATYNLEENNGDEIKGWIDTDYNLYIGSEWKIYAKKLNEAFYGMSGVTSITFDNLNTSEVTDMTHMFIGMSSLTTLDLSSFNTSNVTRMHRMFSRMTSLTSLDLSNFDTSKVTVMQEMFGYNKSLTSLNLSSFNTAKVTNMSWMFYGCNKLTSLDLSSFNTSNVISMAHMFNGMSSLTSLNISSFNTAKVTDMSWMFSNMNSITELNLSNFNTSEVTTMRGMFYEMNALKTLDLTKFNTAKVTDMEAMFAGDESLIKLDIGSFNTSEVTNMKSMFSRMKTLTELNISSFDTSKVTIMGGMFYNCNSLKTLDLSHFKTSEVTDMGSMFQGMTSVTSLNLSNFDTSKVTTMIAMFNALQSLTSLDLSSFDTSSVTNMYFMFAESNILKEILVSDKWVINDSTNITDMFYKCGTEEVTLKTT